jgi:hypothetical protein
MKQILFLPLLFVTILAGAQTRSLHGKIVSANDQRAVSKHPSLSKMEDRSLLMTAVHLN